MAKKTKKILLSTEAKLWLLFNLATLLNLLIVYLISSNIIDYSNFLFHGIYNLTSIFALIPTIPSVLFISLGLIPQGLALFASILVIGLLTNFILVKIVFSKFFKNLYERFLKPNPAITLILVISILVLFFIG